VEIGERLRIVERTELRHETLEEIGDPVGLGNEAVEILPPVAGALRPLLLDEPPLGPRNRIRRRHIIKGEVAGALEMSRPLEARAALAIDQPGSGVGKDAVGIIRRRETLCLEKERPARAEAARDIVEAGRNADQFGLRRAFEVRAPKPQRPLKRTILVEDNARRHECRPGQVIGEAVRLAAVLG